MRHEARKVPSWLIFDVRHEESMKRRKQDILVILALASVAGWSVASAFFAYGMAKFAGSNPQWAAIARENTWFIFFPPRMGLSTISYLVVCIAVSLAAFGVLIYKKFHDITTDNTKNEK